MAPLSEGATGRLVALKVGLRGWALSLQGRERQGRAPRHCVLSDQKTRAWQGEERRVEVALASHQGQAHRHLIRALALEKSGLE